MSDSGRFPACCVLSVRSSWRASRRKSVGLGTFRDPSGNSFPLTDNFTFNPANCGKNCTCDQDPIIQMVWVYDENEGTNVYASDQPQGSRSDKMNGYRSNQRRRMPINFQNKLNMSHPSHGLPGSNGPASTDQRRSEGCGAKPHLRYVDLTVLLFLENLSEQDPRLLLLNYILDSNDVERRLLPHRLERSGHRILNAVAASNAWAPTSGSENDGTATLSHAVALPALSDL